MEAFLISFLSISQTGNSEVCVWGGVRVRVCVSSCLLAQLLREPGQVSVAHMSRHTCPRRLLFLLSHPFFLTPSFVLPAWYILLVDDLDVSWVHMSIICESNGNHGNQENDNLNL